MSLQSLLEKLRALDEKATETPWFIDGEEIRFDCSPETTNTGLGDCTIQICTVSRLTETLDDLANDRILIVEMRNALPPLLEIIETMHTGIVAMEFRCPTTARAILKDCHEIAARVK